MNREILVRRTNKRTGQYEVKASCKGCKSVRWTSYSNFKQSRTGLCWRCSKYTQYLPLGVKWKGRLTPIDIVGRKSENCVYKFKCDCGGTIESVAHSCIRSCGCLRHEPRLTARKPDSDVAVRSFWHQYKWAAKRSNRKFCITFEQFRVLVMLQCYYSGDAPKPRTFQSPGHRKVTANCNGLDRIDNSKGYTLDNVVPCCPTCNIAKSNMSQADFMSWLKRAAAHVSKHEHEKAGRTG